MGDFLTCIVEEGGNEGAVLEEGVAGGDILKVALIKQRVLKHHRSHFQVHKSASNNRKKRWSQALGELHDHLSRFSPQSWLGLGIKNTLLGLGKDLKNKKQKHLSEVTSNKITQCKATRSTSS